MIKLERLLQNVNIAPPLAALDVAGLAFDSRKVKPGFAFFAVPGAKEDGSAYIDAAIHAGASVVITQAFVESAHFVPVLAVADVRHALAFAASRFYPGQPASIVAVTGTSGKTSVAAFVRQILTHLGDAAAALGTTGIVSPSGANYGSLTTPDPITLHQVLDRLHAEGVTHLAMEASSHGLDQHRLDGVRLSAGAFTNLSRDHLDYHADLDSYLDAKLRLFKELLQPGQTAVINADDAVSKKVISACVERGLNILTTGLAGVDLRLVGLEAGAASTKIDMIYQGKTIALTIPLAGDFMISNVLVAAALCIALGKNADNVFSALEHLEGAPGRLEKVGARNGAPIYVDYAHKPDALEKVLHTMRALARGRLIVVFGCGGDRDRGKRPIMGEIASRYADIVIVTDDNPRSEDPAVIRSEIVAHAPKAFEIGDRAQAIAEAIHQLRDGDVLVIAGKGHETGQIVGDQILAFSDHESVRHILGVMAS